ncbi:hypothetical protein NL676_018291 [Syzygium grande]|nr:hypothetical protein NL676_018291 [Syzygium grande]
MISYVMANVRSEVEDKAQVVSTRTCVCRRPDFLEKMMIPFNKEESSLSVKEIREKEEGLRTMECLRGRLLAERQASRFAGEQAQLMANRLVELENQLREETKLRTKTEKKLKFLKKKLETLLISPALHEPEQSSVCETSIVSSDSSSTVTIASEAKITEEAEVESESHKRDSNAGDLSSEKSGPAYNEFKTDGHSCAGARNSVTENENSFDYDEDDQVNDSIALVPVTLPEAEPESKALNAKMMVMSASVSEVLDALRHARESIQRSMEKRNCMIGESVQRLKLPSSAKDFMIVWMVKDPH